MMVIDNKFEIGEMVFLSTDTDQKKRIVTSFTVLRTHIIYDLQCGTEASSHYDIELLKEKDLSLT